MPVTQNEMLTPREVARHLRVSERTVQSLIRSKIIRGTRVGYQWRVSEDDLDAYLEAARESATEDDA